MNTIGTARAVKNLTRQLDKEPHRHDPKERAKQLIVKNVSHMGISIVFV